MYWVGRTPEGNDSLMRVDIDEAGVPAGTPQIVQTFLGNFIGDFSIARDGTSVLWLFRGLGEPVVGRCAVTGSGPAFDPVDLRRCAVQLASPFERWPNRVSSVRRRSAPTAWVIDEDGKNREALTVGLQFGVWGPQWSPDSTRLLVIMGGLNRKPTFEWLDIGDAPVIADGHVSRGGAEPASLARRPRDRVSRDRRGRCPQHLDTTARRRCAQTGDVRYGSDVVSDLVAGWTIDRRRNQARRSTPTSASCRETGDRWSPS